MPQVIDTYCAITTLVFLTFSSSHRAIGLIWKWRSAPQPISSTAHISKTTSVIRHANIDSSSTECTTEIRHSPISIQITNTFELFCTVDIPCSKLRIFTCVIQRSVMTYVVIPRTVQVIRHDVDIIEVLRSLECFHAT